MLFHDLQHYKLLLAISAISLFTILILQAIS